VAKLVREIMDSEPVSVSADTEIERVVRLLREHGLPGVPVVDSEGACVGIVTEADLVLPDPEGDLHLPHYISVFGGLVFIEPLRRFENRLRKAFASTVADMMTAKPDTIAPDATVEEAARKITETGHNRLPVTEDGKLVGVVTRVDVLGALAG
jgi:CBS domain-containing protein